MNRMLIPAALTAAALCLSACVTVIDAQSDYGWTGQDAEPFDRARRDCAAQAGPEEGSTPFIQCMAEKGWTRSRG